MSLARRERRASAGVSDGGIPGLRNPVVAREIDKLEPSIDNSIKLERLRDDLGMTRSMIPLIVWKLLLLLRDVEREFGKELSPFLYDNIIKRALAASILGAWLDDEFPLDVKIFISKELDKMKVEYIVDYVYKGHTGYWSIISNFFSPGATIQEIIDWFMYNRKVFEHLVDAIGSGVSVHLDEMEFRDWLRENNIPLDNPRVKKVLELFNELYSYVSSFNSLIEEFREFIGWKKEEEGEE